MSKTTSTQPLRPDYELKHEHGTNYHILSEPVALTLLARLSQPVAVQPEISYLVRELYARLIHEVVAREFPCSEQSVATRMTEYEPERGIWTGTTIEASTKAVTVNIARAGSLPSQVCFEFLSRLLKPELVRQDHVVMVRTVDAEQHVTGARFGDSKIGGDVDNAVLLFPDPMGATGSSLIEAVNHYRSYGKPRKIIITPEYLQALKAKQPEVIVYALRLDKGLSPVQYILPGAGGLGEIMNNSYC
jgi:uracil phosphoribosyltransferase